jgi:hypothetical protein
MPEGNSVLLARVCCSLALFVWLSILNPLKHTGKRAQTLKTLFFPPHDLCALCDSGNQQRLFLDTALIGWAL